jgi:hypothetical protein
VLGVLGIVGAYALWRFSAPSLYGVVLDAATGRPIPGAMVARKVFREAQVSLTESPGIFAELGSRVETRTDARGRFHLAGYVSLLPIGIQGESGMAWTVFASEYMIAGGCEVKGFPAADGCGAEGGFEHPDSWAAVSSRRQFGAIRLEIRLRPPEPGPGDPWGEYFRRLTILTQFRYIAVDRFVKETKRYAAAHELSASIYDDIYQIQQSLGGLEESGRYNQPEQALILLEIQERYCREHSGDRRCSPAYLEHRRSFLQSGLASNQGSVR